MGIKICKEDDDGLKWHWTDSLKSTLGLDSRYKWETKEKSWLYVFSKVNRLIKQNQEYEDAISNLNSLNEKGELLSEHLTETSWKDKFSFNFKEILEKTIFRLQSNNAPPFFFKSLQSLDQFLIYDSLLRKLENRVQLT